MPRVKMTKLLAGPDGSLHPGKTYDISADLARTLVAADAAIAVDPLGDAVEAPIENETVTPPETALAPRQRGRTRGGK